MLIFLVILACFFLLVKYLLSTPETPQKPATASKPQQSTQETAKPTATAQVPYDTIQSSLQALSQKFPPKSVGFSLLHLIKADSENDADRVLAIVKEEQPKHKDALFCVSCR